MVEGAAMLLGRLRKNDSCNRSDKEQKQPPIQDPSPHALEEVDSLTLQPSLSPFLRAHVRPGRERVSGCPYQWAVEGSGWCWFLSTRKRSLLQVQ